jgi:hypothetical protein
MSRQKKDIPAKKATQHDSNLEKQIHSDQMIALQGQIDLCQQQRRQLIQSRNYAIIVAALACLIVFYLWFIAPPVDCTGQQHTLVARQLAAHKKQLTNQKCIEETIKQAVTIDSEQTISENVRQTISRIDSKLYGKNQTSIDRNGKKISSVLDRLDEPYSDQTKLKLENQKIISRRLHSWALAWELKDLTTYFSYYSKNFKPKDSASDIQEWKAKKSFYIKKAIDLNITLRHIVFKHLDENTATVSFNQEYRSRDYSDNTHKLIELVWENNQWLILRESSITTNVNFGR